MHSPVRRSTFCWPLTFDDPNLGIPRKFLGYDPNTCRRLNTFHYYSDTSRRLSPSLSLLYLAEPANIANNGCEIEDDLGAYYSLHRPYRWRNVAKDTNLPVRYRLILRGIGNEGSWDTFFADVLGIRGSCGDPCPRRVQLTTFSHRTCREQIEMDDVYYAQRCYYPRTMAERFR